MGYGTRFYIKDKQNTFTKYPHKLFSEAFDGIPIKKFEKYSNRTVETLLIGIYYENRIPKEIEYINAERYTFNIDGSLDQDEVLERKKHVVDLLGTYFDINLNNDSSFDLITCSEEKIRKEKEKINKAYANKYIWKLTKEDMEFAIKEVFKKKEHYNEYLVRLN